MDDIRKGIGESLARRFRLGTSSQSSQDKLQTKIFSQVVGHFLIWKSLCD
ncbi:MAG TPA: hypothetical protein V6D48_16060 [Oculatellaceae cyanobacterium]